MTGFSGLHCLKTLRSLIVIASAVFVAASVLEAQEGGGLGLGGGKGKTKKQPPPRTNNPPPKNASNGSELGWITKFEPAKEAESEELLGILSIRPVLKGSKTLKLRVRKTDQSIVQLANHAFESDVYGDVLKKGLLCTADWALEGEQEGKKKSKQKELRSLRFETSDVKGRIEEITEDYVIIRCKPRDDRPWPDMPDPNTSRNAGAGKAEAKPKAALARKLKLRIFEDATKYTDSEQKPIDSGEFETNQDVEATIVYGRSEGILVTLRAGRAKSSEVTDEGSSPPPPKNTGGKKGGGRGLPSG